VYESYIFKDSCGDDSRQQNIQINIYQEKSKPIEINANHQSDSLEIDTVINIELN